MRSVDANETKDSIADAIREAIFSEEFRCNEELGQEDLATQMGLSRTPVREALQQLVCEGFLYRGPNRHVYVSDISGFRHRQCLDMFCVIEKQLITELSEHSSGIEELELTALIGADASGDARELVIGFLKRLSACLDNRYLQRLHDGMVDSYISNILRVIDVSAEEVKSCILGIAAGLQSGRISDALESLDRLVAEIKSGLPS